MKRTLGLLLASVWVMPTQADIDCPETEYLDGYKLNVEVVDEELFLSRGIPLVDGARVFCTIDYDYRNSANMRARQEIGLLDGLRYKVYHNDGSGILQGGPDNTLGIEHYKTNWMLRCQVDKFADTHWCSASKGDLAMGLSKDKRAFASVGYEHYPGSNVSVRVDKNDPLQASAKEGYSQVRTEILISQMLTGESIMTRYQKWPRESNVDARVSLYGFKEVWELLDRLNTAISLK